MTFLEKIKSLFGISTASKEKRELKKEIIREWKEEQEKAVEAGNKYHKEIDEKLNHYKEYGPTLSELYKEYPATPDEYFQPELVGLTTNIAVTTEIDYIKPSRLLKQLIVLRNKGDLTQRQLANEIGISQALLNGLLRGNKAIFESTGSKLDEYFGQSKGTFYNAQLHYNTTTSNTSK